MHDFIIYSHVFFGAICLISGLIPMLVKKGGKVHNRSGQIFFWSMFGIFITALILITFYRFSFFLLVIGVFSFYNCFTGYRVLYRKKPGQQTWVDWTGALITLGAGLSFIGTAVYNLAQGSGFTPYVILLCAFGFFTSSTAMTDIRIFRKPDMDEKLWWFYHHMGAMGGAYIAAITAFAVQMSESHFSHLEYSWLAWLLPAAIGVPGFTFWARSYRKKFALRKAGTATA